MEIKNLLEGVGEKRKDLGSQWLIRVDFGAFCINNMPI
jgi:hypothetical protein